MSRSKRSSPSGTAQDSPASPPEPLGPGKSASATSEPSTDDSRHCTVHDDVAKGEVPVEGPIEKSPEPSADVLRGRGLLDGNRDDEAGREPIEEVPDDRTHPQAPSDGSVARAHLRGLIEALVFASEKPLSASELASTTRADRAMIKELIDEIASDFAPRGIQLCEVAGGFAFRTSPAFAPFVRDLVAQRPTKLTRAQLETLAIVAYRQPITRPEVDDIRGVDTGAVLKLLLERDLVRILGKRDEPGRPLIYGTSSGFLRLFNLKSLRDLPSLREFTELTDESRRAFTKILGEDVPEQLAIPSLAEERDTVLPPEVSNLVEKQTPEHDLEPESDHAPHTTSPQEPTGSSEDNETASADDVEIEH